MQKYIAGHELVPGKTVKDYIRVEGTELLVPYVLICGKEDGVLLYQCSSLNIIEKGPMVAYGVKTGHII